MEFVNARRRFGLLFALLLMGSTLTAQSDDPQMTVEETRQTRMKEFAKSHRLRLPEVGRNAQMKSQPIMRWSNPARQGSLGGATYLWTLDGRPVATLGLWTYKDIKDSYEYQSLSEHSIEATRDGESAWVTTAPGVTFRAIPNADAPGVSTAKRLTQMRRIARRRFEALLSAGTTAEEQLRLLPQPIYRYQKLPANVIDGAVFSYATGTDPEAFLILEARETGRTQKAWFYAFGSQTSGTVDGRLDKKVVWTNANPGDTFLMRVFHGQ